MKKILIVFSILAVCIIVLTALEKTNELDDYEIVTVEEKIPGSSFIHFIHFKNKKSGEIVKTIDLIEDNPYNHLPYEINIYDDRGNKEYKNVEFDVLFPDKNAFVPAYIENVKKVNAGPGYGLYLKSKNYIIVKFYISAGVFDRPYGSKTKMYVYNSKGDLIYSLEDLVGEGGRVCITPDGKNLAYIYGQSLEFSEFPMLKESAGVKVYDIINSEVILDRKAKQGYNLSGVFVRDNSFFIGMPKSPIYRYEIIRLDKKIIYSYEIVKSEMDKLQKLTKDGFQFGVSDLQDKNSYFRSIETDFEVEQF